MSKIFKLKMENSSENIALVRLNTSFIANKVGFDIEEIEDIKVSVSEAVNYQLELSTEMEVEFFQYDDKIEINVINDKLSEKEIHGNLDKFAKMILETLMDEVIFEKDRIFISKKKKV